MWRGAKETADFADFQRFSTSATHDCKRDIYSRFLYLARDISRLFLIITLNYLHIYIYHLIIVYLLLVYTFYFCFIIILSSCML